MDKAKQEAAKNQFLKTNYDPLDEQYCSYRDGLSQGYDAGHSDAAKWIKIETEDDLPKGCDTYPVTTKGGQVKYIEFKPGIKPYVDEWMAFVRAWRPRPKPFTDSTDDSK